MLAIKTKEQKEGMIGTLLFHLLLLLLFIFTGLSYEVPPPEIGLTVNFGTSEVGMGDIQPDVSGETSPNEPDPVKEVVPVQTSDPVESQDEDIVTQDDIDAVPLNSSEEKKTEENPSEEKKNEEPQVSDELQSAFDKMNNAQNQGGSEGDDNQPGDKGQTDGVKDGGAYVGGGSGNGNYRLGNRGALTKPKPIYNCQEEGKVVVIIKVDRNGRTISAVVGKGTTNTAECLTKRAIEAALKTKWQAKNDAPVEQQGSITYHFILR